MVKGSHIGQTHIDLLLSTFLLICFLPLLYIHILPLLYIHAYIIISCIVSHMNCLTLIKALFLLPTPSSYLTVVYLLASLFSSVLNSLEW